MIENLLYLVSLSNFISIAATQIIFGILIFLLFKNHPNISKYPHFRAFIIFFILVEISFILNYYNVKHFVKKLFHWWLYFPFFLSYFFINSENLANKLFKFIFIGASISSLYGLWQFFALSIRAQGFYSHALTSGNNWALALILCYGVILGKAYQNKKELCFYLVNLIIIGLGLIVSQAKGPIMYFFIVSFFLNYIFLKHKGILLSLIILFLLILAIFCSPSLQKRFVDLYKGFNNPYTSTGSRVILWKNTLKIIKEKPFFGIGGNFKKEIQKKVKIKLKWRSHPHNAYLTVAVNHGILALLALIYIFCEIFKKLITSLKLNKENKYTYICLAYFTLYLMEGLTENNFGDSEVKMFFWFTMGIFYALIFKIKQPYFKSI